MRRPVPYLALTAVLVALLMSALAAANYRLAPLTYSAAAQAEAAAALAAGDNYAVFDLNIDSRGLQRAHIARLPARPGVAVLGASHWQEAHADLVAGHSFYNAHVHRDYYEDLLAVVEMMVRHDRLPRTMLMSIRGFTFLPEDRRTDTLWLTALPDSNAMLARLGIARQPWLETRKLRRWLGLLSLSTMLDHAWRRFTADTLPGPVEASSLPTMDVLQADGSIRWSDAHRDLFTPERRDHEVQKALAERRDLTLDVDPVAVEAVDRLLSLLTERGVRVVLIHPPLNPDFYRQIQGTAYGDGLLRIEALTARLAAAHGMSAVGSFDPAVPGCSSDMYIDAEHSGPDCLRRVIDLVPGL
ncbi:MAG TPA: hypothetical protein VFV80_01310 [Geminicoccaceae bacterium]|nr:hypothetical protein [Geminicoccaceae bacterium]